MINELNARLRQTERNLEKARETYFQGIQDNLPKDSLLQLVDDLKEADRAYDYVLIDIWNSGYSRKEVENVTHIR